jgi:hypothetical protein
MVPLLIALTDRVPVRRVYMLGTSLTALSHFGFALFADGFWSALLLRLFAGIGWAGTYMPGLKAIADPLEGTAQSRRFARLCRQLPPGMVRIVAENPDFSSNRRESRRETDCLLDSPLEGTGFEISVPVLSGEALTRSCR